MISRRLMHNAAVAAKFADQHNDCAIGRAPQLRVVSQNVSGRVVGFKFQLSTQATNFAKGAVRKLRPLDLCRVAFDKRRNRSADADTYRVSRQTVMRGLILTCQSVLEQQMALMRDFALWAVAHKPHAAAAGLCWDETGQTLALGKQLVHGVELGLQQQRSTWNVLVARLHFCIAFTNGVKLFREMILPPVPLATNSSAAIYLGLRKHPLTRALMDYVDKILQAADHSILLHEGSSPLLGL